MEVTVGIEALNENACFDRLVAVKSASTERKQRSATKLITSDFALRFALSSA